MIKSTPILLLLFCALYHIRADTTPYITVTGTGQVKVQPTQATVSIAVDLRDKNVQTLRTNIDSTASKIIAYLKSQGIAATDIQTSYLTVQPVYNWNNGVQSVTPDYYSGTKAMTFVLKKLANYDSIMSGLYALGLNRVDGVSFGVADTDTPSTEAKKLAVANAKKIATAMTSAVGAKLGSVYSISDNVSYGYSPIIGKGVFADSAAGASVSGPSIAAGQITFSATATVVFTI